MAQLNKSITTEFWYEALLEDVKSILVEHEFTARWARILQYHQTGQRILQDQNKAPLKDLVSGVSRDLNVKPRTIYRAVQFAKQYPDLNQLPEGKAISWTKIVHKYLPSPKTKACNCPEDQRSYYYQCKKCLKWVKLDAKPLKNTTK